jgi:glutaredoxin 3
MAAKRFLKRRGVDFEEIQISDADQRQKMIERADGRHTVPQIFIGDRGIGGYMELRALASSGELDELLSAPVHS